MKHIKTLMSAAAALLIMSCSTYRQAQTPDDVYHSPGTAAAVNSSSNPNDGSGSEYYSQSNDQYVRLKTEDPARWSYFDNYATDYYGGFSPYGYGPSMGVGFGYGGYGFGYGAMGFGFSPWIGFGYWNPFSYWNSYYSWNGMYNPYYPGIIVVNPKVGGGTYAKQVTFNPASYTNNNFYAGGLKRTAATASTPYNYGQTIQHNYSANSFRNPNTHSLNNNVYRPANTNQPARTYAPSASSTHSFGGGGGFSGGSSHGGGGGGFSRGR